MYITRQDNYENCLTEYSFSCTPQDTARQSSRLSYRIIQHPSPLGTARQSSRLSYRALKRQDNRRDCLTEIQIAQDNSFNCLTPLIHLLHSYLPLHTHLHALKLDFSSFSLKTCVFRLVFQVLCLINLLVWFICLKTNGTLPDFRLKSRDFRPCLLRFVAYTNWFLIACGCLH